MKKLVNKIKDNLNIFQSSKGFTLLELLVVVLIIGILAGIALPQYQMAVGKARFATLKNITKSLAESHQRYYLMHNESITDFSQLDIEKPSNISCNPIGHTKMRCCKEIFNKRACYYSQDNGKSLYCTVFSLDTDDKVNHLCQKETGKTAAYCQGDYCTYFY